MTELYACACCGYPTLTEKPPATYEICPVCFWEDDSVRDPALAGGANGVSLNDARANFGAFGACDERCRASVRPPTALERSRRG
jgi:cysteine-rich CPCC protein